MAARRVAVALVCSALVASCGGTGGDEARNVVVTPRLSGGPSFATQGNVYQLQYDAATASVSGGATSSGIEEGVLFSGASILNTTDPADTTAVETFPTFKGDVEMVESDGNGGWFVVGSFDNAEGELVHVAHVGADGSLDADFASDVTLTPRGFTTVPVLHFAAHPLRKDRLVLVARMSSVAGLPVADAVRNCPRIVMLDRATGEVTDRFDLDGSCPDFATMWRSLIVIGGDFSTVGGQARTKIAAIDTSTWAVASTGKDFGTVFPSFNTPQTGRQRIAGMWVAGDVLYVAGRVSKTGQYVAAVKLLTGLVDQAWRPDGRLPIEVTDVQVKSQVVMATTKHVIVGGCLGAGAPGRFVAHDRVTGVRVPWAADIEWKDPDCANSMAAFPFGNTMLVTGNFDSVGGVTVPNQVWLNYDGRPVAQQLPVAIDWPQGSAPHSKVARARWFPASGRIFLGLPSRWSQLVVNARFMGPHLSASADGVTRQVRYSGEVEGLVRGYSVATGGKIYVESVEEAQVLLDSDDPAKRRIIHRFDPVTGERDPSFEIVTVGVDIKTVIAGDSVVAVIGWGVDDEGNHAYFYSKVDGRPLGAYPRGLSPSLPWGLDGAVAVGDSLVAYGESPAAGGNIPVVKVARIDMTTSETTMFGDGPVELEPSGYFPPSIVGGQVYVPATLAVGADNVNGYRIFNLASGAFVRDATEIFSGGWTGDVVEVGGRVIGLRKNENNRLEMAAFNRETSAFEEIVIANAYSISAIVGAGNGAAAWFSQPTRQPDDKVLTGLVALDGRGKPTNQVAPDRPLSTEVMPQEPVVGGTGADDPLTRAIVNQIEAISGRITIESVTSGNRSLTVKFAANGNDGPFDVRVARGKKICTTSNTTCTFKNLVAYDAYSFTVETRGRGAETMSAPSSAVKPVVTLKKGRTLKLAGVIKPASRTAVKWKSSKKCRLDAARGILTAPKQATVCTVSVTSKAKGKKAVVRTIKVRVG